jgi:hypothetical protein
VIEDIRGILDDVVDRLLRLPESRLTAAGADARTVAVAGHELAQRLADTAAGVEARQRQAPPESRAVPWLGPFGVAHQVAVTGADLVAACLGLDASVAVWADTSRRDLGAVLAERAALLREFGRRL